MAGVGVDGRFAVAGLAAEGERGVCDGGGG